MLSGSTWGIRPCATCPSPVSLSLSWRAPPVDASSGSSSGASTGSSGAGPDAGPITGLNGNVYYVSASSGKNPAAGTQSAPWKTVQQAGGVVGPGDTVIVEAGTYDGPIFGWDSAPCAGDAFCVVAGNATNPVLFEADPAATPGTVVIAAKNSKNSTGFDLEPGCNYVDIVGFTVTNDGTSGTAAGSITKAGIGISGCTGNRILHNTVDGVSGIGGIFVDTSTDVIVSGNTITNVMGTGTTGHGMYVSGSSVGVQVLDNVLHDNAYVGLHVNGDVSEGLPGVVKNLLVAGNLIYKNGPNSINCDGIENSTFENNVIYGNARNGIELYQIDAYGGSTSNVIVNNTIDQSMVAGSYAIAIGQCQYDNQSAEPTPASCSSATADTSTGNVAFNNVLLGGASGGLDSLVSAADLSLSNNITAPSSTLFVDAAGGNYQLAPGGGGTGSGISSFDAASAPAVSAGSYDIGAFSFAK
jgi:Right handed beta helix region